MVQFSPPIITVPNRRSPGFFNNKYYDYPPYHLTRWDKEALGDFLQRSGFRVITAEIRPFVWKDVADPVTIPLVTGLVLAVKKLIFKKTQLPADVLRNVSFEALSAKSGAGGCLYRSKSVRAAMVKLVDYLALALMSPVILPVYLFYKLTNGEGSAIFMLARRKDG